MTWRNPTYGTLHVARDDSTGAFEIVAAGGGAPASPPGVVTGGLYNLADNRAGSMLEWDDAEYLRLDRSASPGTTPDTLFIPAGHNLTAITVYKRATTTGSTTDVGNLSGLTTTDPIYIPLASIDRYLDIAPTTSGGVNAMIGEAVYTAMSEPTIGPEPGWTDPLSPVGQRVTFDAGGSALLEKGAAQRVLSLEYPYAAVAGDVTIFTAIEDSVGRPLVMLPPYTTTTVRWVYLDGSAGRAERSGLPGAQSTLIPLYSFTFREQTL